MEKRGKLANAVHAVPDEIDYDVAARKLRATGMHIDVLSEKQSAYLSSWAL